MENQENIDFTDKGRSAFPSQRAEGEICVMQQITLRRDVAEALNACAAKNGFKFEDFLGAAWALLIARYSGEENVVFDVLHGNPRAEIPCRQSFNALPVHASILPGQPLFHLLKSIHEQQAFPGDRKLAPPPLEIEGGKGFASPFHSLVVFGNAPPQSGLGIHKSYGYALVLYVCTGLETTLEIVASTNCKPVSISLIPGHLATILEAMQKDCGQTVGGIPMLTDAEREQFALWNKTEHVFSDTKCVHEFVEATTRLTPGRTAVRFNETAVTYREINARANQLARHMRARGVASGSLVGICLDRSVEMIVSMLAIFKSGAAYVPLDPGFPGERIAYMIKNSSATPIITQERIAANLPVKSESLLCLDIEWPEIASRTAEDLDLPVSSRSIAYVMHTSGSTGKPKGIAIEHRSVVNFLESMRREPGIDQDDVLLAVTTISFDISVLEIFLPLMAGAEVHVVSREVFTDPKRLAVQLDHATIMQATPATWRTLVESGWRGNSKLKILCGGEAIAPDVARELLDRCSELWNMYGPTETTVWSTCHRIENITTLIPVGHPIANTTIHVLGKDLQPQPVDVAGELYIGGAGLARGYHNLPELTREKFIPDPFSSEPGARLYATGDLARITPGGTIEVLGRIDRQIKIRGFRIEAGEIETRLNEYPGVQRSAVVAHEYTGGEKALVAYLVAGATDLPIGKLRAFLMETLPDYMIPSAFIALEKMPLTPNGKVDNRALPSPDLMRPALSADFMEPRNEAEKKLAAIWCELLHREAVGVHDNFFDLGGHSLTATALATRVSSEFNVEFPLREIFQQPTIAKLAPLIAQLAPQTGAALPVLHRDPPHAHDPFPLTEMQQAYVAGRSAGFELGNISLHDYVEFEPEHFDLDRANKALRTLIGRHAMLRAVVCGDGIQRVLEQVPDYSINEIDLRNEPVKKIDAVISGMRERMSHQIFDVTKWPWFEMHALRMDENRFRLLISCDALMIDAWSAYLLVREFTTLMAEPDAVLPPVDATFRDCVLAEIEWHESAAYLRAKDYWTGRLASLPPPPALPLAKPPGAISKPRFARRLIRLDATQWKHFQKYAAKNSITPGMALITAYSEILARWSQSRRFTLNIPIFNRLPIHPDINEIVGHFTTLLLLTVDFSKRCSFADHARGVQQQLWSDLEHRAYGGAQVARDLARVASGEGLASAPIVTTNVMLEEGFQSSLPGRVEFAITQTPQVLLDQMAAVSNGELLVWWDAVEELFPENVLDEMFNAFCGLVSRLAKDEDTWSVIEIQAPLVQPQVAREVSPESRELLHTLFLKQIPAHREKPAVVSPSRTLSYGELHQRAVRIAQRVREAGAAPNTLVAIVMEKGWEQIVASLGILYSGAAYLPIDAKLPAERLKHLLVDGEVKIALIQSRFSRKIEPLKNMQCICVDEEGESADEFDIREQPTDDLAYVIYTSGSTGLPKGVMIDHRGAVNTILDINSRFQVTATDRVFALSSLTFDLSVYDIFGTLAAGGTIVMPSADDTLDPAHWAEVVAREGVTIWNSVPALMKLFVEYASPIREMAASKLRLVLLSGDWIPLTLPDQIRSLAPRAEIISLGGATEASVWSILFPVENIDPAWKSIPYGRAMVNQTFHVLDSALEPRPVWVVGELYIGGIGLAKGYWHDVEKSAARFIVHPQTGERLYRTGDLGRWLPDGNIEFLGREDSQVKIQGFRIELEEIEAVLLQHPGLSAAVVTARGALHGDKKLGAYVISKNGAISTNELREFLLAKLPGYMVPSAFMNIDRLPLGANGKIDRSALPDIAVTPEPPRSPPSDAATARVEQIVGRILKIGNIDPQANLLNLGATSLNMISIASALEREMQFRPKISQLYRNPTIAALVCAFNEGGLVTQSPLKSDTAELIERIKKMSSTQVAEILATTRI